ncbi:two-component hybrid sensor and regulator [Candidatus Vecturithrix granuli]|uniref:Two-component hybrid sensor and regulator n=1 Tax=Vecturithrix granuli TaxID=1499967 RepID=A0A081C7T5_VECG1|nr:two-component hybrid sensor and regulator [Candidatus Vecturithrix granuli]
MNKKEQPKILLVDDERYNIHVLVNILKTDYRTIVAKNGEGALKRACATPLPDLILLDIMMPGMDGYEVCRQLKANPQTREIPVIFITAMSEIQDETRGLELGAIDYLTKPINPAIVLARIKNHLALQAARKEIEQQKQQLEKQNKELREAARLREDVEQIARHDLKTPLNVVIGMPRMILEEGNLSDRQIKYLTMIETSGYRMLKMINQSLNLLKMERGLYQVTPVAVNLLQVFSKILAEIQNIRDSLDISLDIFVNGDHPEPGEAFFVYGEELLCYSMFENLLKNALEASKSGEQITISCLEQDARAVIHIHNQGVIPASIRDRFFDKYVTYGKRTTGIGLGTYSARLFAETMGGTISFETSEEHGTTLFVQLPRSKSNP